MLYLYALQVKILVDKVVGDANQYSPKDFVLPALQTITNLKAYGYHTTGPIANDRFPYVERIVESALSGVGLGTQVRHRIAYPMLDLFAAPI
jgi:hypothetical protein